MMISTTAMNTALMQWHPPKEMVGELLGYRLQYKRVDEEKMNTIDFGRNDHHYTVTNLHKGATYIFKLSAKNRAGLGEEFEKEITTTEDVPSGFPQNLRVVGLTTSTTEVAWDPPVLAERNGRIVSYTVVYRDINSQQDLTNVTRNTNITLTNLKPDTTYDIKVRARTNKGPGPLSPSIQSRTMPVDQGKGSLAHPDPRKAPSLWLPIPGFRSAQGASLTSPVTRWGVLSSNVIAFVTSHAGSPVSSAHERRFAGSSADLQGSVVGTAHT